MLEDRETTAGDDTKNSEILCCLDAIAARHVRLVSIIYLYVKRVCHRNVGVVSLIRTEM